MASWLQDFRFGVRNLLRARAFAALAITTLALGIGAVTAMFSVVYGVLLRPLPFPNAERVAIYWEVGKHFGDMSIAYPNYVDWRKATTKIDELAIYRRTSPALSGDGDPERLAGAQVSANLFDALGLKTRLGRGFGAEDDRVGAARVAIISDTMWQRRFGGAGDVVGRTVSLDGVPTEIVGVLEPGVPFPSATQVWLPIGAFADTPGWDRGNHPGIYGVARLAPGATFEQAQAEMDTIARALEQQYPDTNAGNGVRLQPLVGFFSADRRAPLLTLFAAVAFVLLIACVNVANLVSTRLVGRRTELAVHAAMGASSRRLARQSLGESLAIACASAVLGIGLAALGIELLMRANPDMFPAALRIRVDAPIAAFAVLAALASVALFGLLPAWRAGRADPQQALRDGARGMGDRAGRRAGRVLGTLQVALTVVLLVGACLLTKSLVGLVGADLGIETERRLSFAVSLPQSGYADDQARTRFVDALLPRLAALPGVHAAGVSSNLPMLDGSQTGHAVAGRPEPPSGERPSAEYAEVNSDYFRAVGVKLLEGRLFDATDARATTDSIVVDRRFALKEWPGESAIGKQILHGHGDERQVRTVVGVVSDVDYRGAAEAPSFPQMYFPYHRGIYPRFRFVLAAGVDPETLTGPVRREVAAVDAALPVYDVRSMDDVVAASLVTQRVNSRLMSVFAALAMFLSAIGIYGVLAYDFARRTREIGVRLALGASRGTVSRLVLGDAGRIVVAGAALGLVGAWLAGRALESMLVGVRPDDATAYGLALAFVAGVGLAAAARPAWRACRVAPMAALRED